jgi:hypothetical protein
MSKFDSKEDMIDYLVEEFEESEDICIVANRQIASIFMNTYDDETEFDLYSVELSTENNLYYISKLDFDSFVIEPSIRNKEYVDTEADRIFIVTDDKTIINDDLLKALDGDIEYVYYENEDYGLEDKCTCQCGCCNCCGEDEEKDSYFNQLNDDEKDFVFKEVSNVIDDINLEFISKIYLLGHKNGIEDGLLSIKEAIDNAIDEE